MGHEILVRPERGRLVPADQLAEEDICALKPAEYLVTIRKPRSLQHHRLLFLVLRKIADACPTKLSEEALLSWVKVKTGHVEYVPLSFGRSYAAPASIAFHNMEQPEFAVFFDKVVELIRTELIPGLPENFAEWFEAAIEHPDRARGRAA